MTGKFSIILDMDEVLTDFVGSALQLWGLMLKDVEPHWPVGCWDMCVPINAVRTTQNKRTIDDAVFWRSIQCKGVQFWASMPKTPYCDEVLALVRKHVGEDFHIVSDPSKGGEDAHRGKLYWIKQNLGQDFTRFSFHPHKHRYARHDTVLIDDGDHNLKAFAAKGGYAVTFPRLHNELHSKRNDPVGYVRKRLEEITRLRSS